MFWGSCSAKGGGQLQHIEGPTDGRVSQNLRQERPSLSHNSDNVRGVSKPQSYQNSVEGAEALSCRAAAKKKKSFYKKEWAKIPPQPCFPWGTNTFLTQNTTSICNFYVTCFWSILAMLSATCVGYI